MNAGPPEGNHVKPSAGSLASDSLLKEKSVRAEEKFRLKGIEPRYCGHCGFPNFPANRIAEKNLWVGLTWVAMTVAGNYLSIYLIGRWYPGAIAGFFTIIPMFLTVYRKYHLCSHCRKAL